MKLTAACAAAAAALCLNAAHAVGPADYVIMPGVSYGEKEIDFKYGTWKQTDADRFSAASVGFGYGVSQRWFTELYAKYERANGENTRFDAFEWENKFQLTEPGEYPVDLGFVAEIERPRQRSEGYEVTFGPLLQTEFGKLQLNGNLLFQRHYRAEEEAGPMELNYQWQAKYRWLPQFEVGLQGFGELGKWNRWESRDERIHLAGPAVFGKLPLGGRQAIRYNAAWLFGTSRTAPDHAFRMQVEYEF